MASAWRQAPEFEQFQRERLHLGQEPANLLLCVTSLALPCPLELEQGKNVHDTAWADRAAAEAEVEASRRRLREQENRPG